MKHSLPLLFALFLATATIVSCTSRDDVIVTPTPDIADALVGTYLTYDTATYTQSGNTTVGISAGSGTITKVSSSQVRFNKIVASRCIDSTIAEVSTTILVPLDNTCQSGLIITRVGANLVYTFDNSDPAGSFSYSQRGRAVKQP